MQNEVLYLLHAAASGSSYSINSQLTTVPLLPGQATPTQVTAIVSEIDNSLAALGLTPDQDETALLPLVRIEFPHDSETQAVYSGVQDAKIPVQVLLCYRDVDTSTALMSFYATYRAIRRFVNDWFLSQHDDDRALNSVQIYNVDNWIDLDMAATENEKWIIGGCRFDLYVRDNVPQ